MRFAETFLVASMATVSASALAADPQQGRVLYDTYCGTCHYEKLHDRKSTQLKSVADLRVAVSKWSLQVKRSFTPAELDDIAEYLDQSHYKLAK